MEVWNYIFWDVFWYDFDAKTRSFLWILLDYLFKFTKVWWSKNRCVIHKGSLKFPPHRWIKRFPTRHNALGRHQLWLSQFLCQLFQGLESIKRDPDPQKGRVSLPAVSGTRTHQKWFSLDPERDGFLCQPFQGGPVWIQKGMCFSASRFRD